MTWLVCGRSAPFAANPPVWLPSWSLCGLRSLAIVERGPIFLGQRLAQISDGLDQFHPLIRGARIELVCRVYFACLEHLQTSRINFSLIALLLHINLILFILNPQAHFLRRFWSLRRAIGRTLRLLLQEVVDLRLSQLRVINVLRE